MPHCNMAGSYRISGTVQQRRERSGRRRAHLTLSMIMRSDAQRMCATVGFRGDIVDDAAVLTLACRVSVGRMHLIRSTTAERMQANQSDAPRGRLACARKHSHRLGCLHPGRLALTRGSTPEITPARRSASEGCKNPPCVASDA